MAHILHKTYPAPRDGSYLGMPIGNQWGDNRLTWVEGEEFAYPAGGFTRLAYAVCPDGTTRLCKVSIPDTCFSIPARCAIGGKRVKGFVSFDTDRRQFTFTPTDK